MADNQKEYARKYKLEHVVEGKKYNHEWYLKNKAHSNAKSKRYHREHREERNGRLRDRYSAIGRWFYLNVNALDCPDCGLSFREVLPGFAQFHHVNNDGTERSVLAIAKTTTYNRATEELNKGIFLCPNCHVIEHLHLKEGVNCRNSELKKRK